MSEEDEFSPPDIFFMVEFNEEDASPPSEFSFTVQSSKMDFRVLLEAGVRPPIAFKDRDALNQWLQTHNLKGTRVGARDAERNVLFVNGSIKAPKQEVVYSQIWVAVDYKRYRPALVYKANESEKDFQQEKLKLPDDDADHAVGRTRLKEKWPYAWVNLLFVEGGVNRGFGAMMEKDELVVSASQTCIELDLICLLKTFLAKKAEGYKREHLASYLKDVRSCFLDSSESEEDREASNNASRLLTEMAIEGKSKVSQPLWKPL
jgi:hypothetical protein